MHRFECHQGPPGPGVQIESCCPGPGNSWGSGVSAILPASKEAESPSPQINTIPYPAPFNNITYVILALLAFLQLLESLFLKIYFGKREILALL